MNRLDAKFSNRNRKVLVAYLCVGDPSPEETFDLACACVERGADVIELESRSAIRPPTVLPFSGQAIGRLPRAEVSTQRSSLREVYERPNLSWGSFSWIL